MLNGLQVKFEKVNSVIVTDKSLRRSNLWKNNKKGSFILKSPGYRDNFQPVALFKSSHWRLLFELQNDSIKMFCPYSHFKLWHDIHKIIQANLDKSCKLIYRPQLITFQFLRSLLIRDGSEFLFWANSCIILVRPWRQHLFIP